VLEAFRHAGIRILRNETLDVDGVSIAGIDDGLFRRDRHDFLEPTQDRNVVALFHEPDFVDRVDQRASLMISGHTHGGQVCWPWGRAVHLPNGGRAFQRGFFEETKVPLYVSRGVGTIGPDFRFFAPPEVSILSLTS